MACPVICLLICRLQPVHHTGWALWRPVRQACRQRLTLWLPRRRQQRQQKLAMQLKEQLAMQQKHQKHQKQPIKQHLQRRVKAQMPQPTAQTLPIWFHQVPRPDGQSGQRSSQRH